MTISDPANVSALGIAMPAVLKLPDPENTRLWALPAAGSRVISGPFPDAPSARLEVLKPVTLLNITENSEELARLLLDRGAVPQQAAADAAHIAIAVTNGVDYLVTWNFKRIANAVMRSGIEQACRQAGYEPSVICTPNELIEIDYADDTT